MGTKFSAIQKLRAKAKADDESDDDDDEHWEVEVDKCNNGECKTDHNLYILIEDLIFKAKGNDSLNMLPEDIRHESVLEYISIQEKLVVRIKANTRGDKGEHLNFGTGCVHISTTKELEEFSDCPLLNCSHNNGQPHKCYGGLIVYTNKHVIEGNSEAQSCTVDFFYYNDEVTEVNTIDRSSDCRNSLPPVDQGKHEANSLSLDGKNIMDSGRGSNVSVGTLKCVTAYGLSLRENMEHKDLVGLRIVYHDQELYTTIKRYSELTSMAWLKIPPQIKSALKKRVIIISHPHGWPKRVSFGDLKCLEEDDKKEKYRKVTRYTAATCGGSSGAPVLTGHYPNRPFVHSSKAQFGASFSY